MTYQDPNLPGPGLGQNPSTYRKVIDTNTWSTGNLIAGAVAVAVVIGGLVYSLRDSTTSVLPPPTTSGQGTTPVNPPMAPPSVAPHTDEGVPPGVIGSPIDITPPNLDSK